MSGKKKQISLSLSLCPEAYDLYTFSPFGNKLPKRLKMYSAMRLSVATRLRETGTPHIPAQRSRRSLWNAALLDIEQISSYYKNNNTRV